MTRTVGSFGPRTQEAIKVEGLRLIYEHGYEALTIRQLAQAVNITQGAIYNHLKNKQELLYGLVHEHMMDLLAELDRALDGRTGPRERLLAFVTFHVDYHATRRREVYIANSELRSLTRPHKAAILKLRQRYEKTFIDILDQASEAGVIRVTNAKVTAYAIIAMLTGVSSWYHPSRDLQREEIIRIHTELVLSGLGSAPEPARPGQAAKLPDADRDGPRKRLRRVTA